MRISGWCKLAGPLRERGIRASIALMCMLTQAQCAPQRRHGRFHRCPVNTAGDGLPNTVAAGQYRCCVGSQGLIIKPTIAAWPAGATEFLPTSPSCSVEGVDQQRGSRRRHHVLGKKKPPVASARAASCKFLLKLNDRDGSQPSGAQLRSRNHPKPRQR